MTTWKKDFCALQGSDLVEPFSQTPGGDINESLSELGKGKAWVQEVIETRVCTRKVLQILNNLENAFVFVKLFYVVPCIFSTPIRIFIAFQTEDVVEHHPTYNSAFSPGLTFIQKCKVWRMEMGHGTYTHTRAYPHAHAYRHVIMQSEISHKFWTHTISKHRDFC